MKHIPLTSLIPLPIDPLVPELLAALERGTSLVLQASPGSGKTTRVPPALLRAAFRKSESEILVLEPRRLAAKWAARRVAEELGEPVGKTVGYQFRFETVAGPETRLRFLTEGMLMRRLLSDPELRNVAAVVLDEFHERHLHGDLALGYLRRLQRTSRPELRVIAMSATLETEKLSEFLGGCPVLRSESRTFPIEIEHLKSAPAQSLEITVRDTALAASADRSTGDTLGFLPGMREILKTSEALGARLGGTFDILALHGDLSREEQDRAMLPSKRRKIILATNVAETSLTIPGITTVIDSGLHRIASYSWWSGIPALKTRPISRASAIQRAGRAGRTGPGRCLRLYTQGDFESRAPFELPELLRADLCQTTLELRSLGIADPSRFEWFEAPPETSLEACRELLYRLGALSDRTPKADLTEIGKRMARLPTHPRLARLLIEAERSGCLEDAATLAALIAEGRLETFDALESISRAPRDEGFRKARTQLLSAFSAPRSRSQESRPRPLGFTVLTGFPDRVMQPKNGALLLSTGETATLGSPESALNPSCLFVALDLQEQQGLGQARSKLKVRSVCDIEPEWLFDLEPTVLEERDELTWDRERERVTAASRLVYDRIILSESKSNAQNSPDLPRFLLREGIGIPLDRERSAPDWIQALEKVADRETLESALARVHLVARHLPELGVPDPLERDLQPMILDLLVGKTCLEDVRQMDWASEIVQRLAPEHLGRFETLVPTQIALPGSKTPGRKAKIQYRLGQPPWLESRLQDFFGMKKAPSLLNGRVPLTLHLLAPNFRAVQVTTDLEGFWKRAYPEVRKELSRRYPRHAWPEDPFSF